MGYHHVKYATFGVGTEAPGRLEAALARAGRRVLGREPLPLDGRSWPVVERDTLTMFVWKLELPEDSILWVEEHPWDREEGTFHRFREQFDMVLLRALSAETDGFVIGYDMLSSATQAGTAVFFAGRTLEAALMASGSMVADPCIGLRSLNDLGTWVDLAFRRRLADPHGGASLTLEPEGEMLLRRELACDAADSAVRAGAGVRGAGAGGAGGRALRGRRGARRRGNPPHGHAGGTNSAGKTSFGPSGRSRTGFSQANRPATPRPPG